MMKLAISTVVVLLACCCLANGWFFRNSDYPRYSRHIFSSPSGRTTFDVGNEDYDDYFRTWAGMNHEGSNWHSSVRGSIDSDANFDFNADFSYEFRKRSADWKGNHYNITLYVDPCNFYTYDYDRNGTIVMDELHAVFGNNKKTDAFFDDLDVTKGDEGITPNEFYTIAPMIIADCLDTEE